VGFAQRPPIVILGLTLVVSIIMVTIAQNFRRLAHTQSGENAAQKP
jgi:hypothetical protein